mmetsp:Transcript_9488/g.23970  ORF Transcript_9488/g.23970 Transcript_9488/m.23970 type:complete len:387 (+) Transcript_9488:220-1380(+)
MTGEGIGGRQLAHTADSVGERERGALCWPLLAGALAGPRVLRVRGLGGAEHGARYGRDAVDELRPEDDVCVVEHALLERDHHELRLREVLANHRTDVLRVAQVEGRVHLVQDVERRRLEEQQREHERQRDQRALPAGELEQRRFPRLSERHVDHKPIVDGLPVGRFELGVGVRQQRAEDGAEVGVHLGPGLLKRLLLLAVERGNDGLDLALVALDDPLLARQLGVLRLGPLEHGERLLVDALREGLVVFAQGAQPLRRLAHVAAAKVVVRAGSTEARLLLPDPPMSRSEVRAHAYGRLEVLLGARELLLHLLGLEALLTHALAQRERLRARTRGARVLLGDARTVVCEPLGEGGERRLVLLQRGGERGHLGVEGGGVAAARLGLCA